MDGVGLNRGAREKLDEPSEVVSAGRAGRAIVSPGRRVVTYRSSPSSSSGRKACSLLNMIVTIIVVGRGVVRVRRCTSGGVATFGGRLSLPPPEAAGVMYMGPARDASNYIRACRDVFRAVASSSASVVSFLTCSMTYLPCSFSVEGSTNSFGKSL